MLRTTRSIALGVCGLALLTLCACGSRELKGHVTDQEGEVVTDLGQVEALQDVYTQPRRYPFTVAVAPLYVEWADQGVNQDGESSVHPLTLATPLPGVDVLDYPVTDAWPEGVDAEEEALILEALRKGFVRDEQAEDGAPEDGMPEDGAPEDGAPEDGAPEDGEPEDGEPEDGAPEDGAPEDGAPEDGAPEDGAPKDGAPEDGGPEDGAAEDGAPEDGAPEDGEPEDGAPAKGSYPWPEEETPPRANPEVPLEDGPADDAPPGGAPAPGEPADEGGEPADEGGEPTDEGGEPADAGGEPADAGGEPADDDPWHDSGAQPLEAEPVEPTPDQGSRLERHLRRYPSRNAAPPPDGDQDAGGEDGDGEDGDDPDEDGDDPDDDGDEDGDDPDDDGDEDGDEDGDGGDEDGDGGDEAGGGDAEEAAPVDPLAEHDVVVPARDDPGSRLGLRLPEGFEVEEGDPLRLRSADALLFELGSRALPLDQPTPEDASGLNGILPGEALEDPAPQAIELGGRPGWKWTVQREDGTQWITWGVYAETDAFVLSSPADADAELQQTVLSSVEFAPPQPQSFDAAEDPEAAAARMEAEAARAREADTFEGKNFGISETGWQERTVGLLRQFGVFERVEKIDFSQDSQRANPLELLPLADLAGADLLLVAKLRRNKVSYRGINAAYAGDFFLWLTLWWPSAIWPGVSSEDYRADVELVVELLDVRSQEVLWSKTYRHDETLPLSTPERGWVPWGVVFARFGLLTDGMLSGAGEHVRTPTWLEVEYQILRDLWSVEGFKGVVDTQTFEERINTNVTPRRLALACGVSRYGPRAQPVLNRLGAAAASARGESLEQLRATYEDDELEFGARPYAEADVRSLGQFLREQGAFNQDFSRELIGPEATRTRLKASLRQLARARRPDPVLLYVNLRTVVVDDPEAPGDRLRKYLLPYDADLAGLEALLAQPAGPERTQAMLAHLERTAISFAWIEETFNHANLEDHRYLQSRNVALIFDVAFPDPVTGLRYAPEFRERRDEEAELRLSADFLQPLAQVPGRVVVVGTRFFERPLDVVPKRSGGLIYHLLRGALEDGRVPLGSAGTKPLGTLLDYTRRQVEKESRILNRAQSLLELGTNREFPLVDRR